MDLHNLIQILRSPRSAESTSEAEEMVHRLFSSPETLTSSFLGSHGQKVSLSCLHGLLPLRFLAQIPALLTSPSAFQRGRGGTPRATSETLEW